MSESIKLITAPNGEKWWCPAWDAGFGGGLATGGGLSYDSITKAAVKEQLIARYGLERGGTFLDVGAHIGFWTIPFAKDFDRVIAFEPQPENMACLMLNVTGHGHNTAAEGCGQVTFWDVPVGNVPTKGDMVRHTTGENSGMYMFQPRETGLKHSIRLDDLHVKDVRFIKIDVEGYELNVLQGAKNLIERDRPLVLIESNGLEKQLYGHQLHAPEQFLTEDLGYQLIVHIESWYNKLYGPTRIP